MSEREILQQKLCNILSEYLEQKSKTEKDVSEKANDMKASDLWIEAEEKKQINLKGRVVAIIVLTLLFTGGPILMMNLGNTGSNSNNKNVETVTNNSDNIDNSVEIAAVYNVIESDTEIGYEFDVTLDDFVANWNRKANTDYGKITRERLICQKEVEDASGKKFECYYLYGDPLANNAVVVINVNKTTGNIYRIDYLIDQKYHEQSHWAVKQNVEAQMDEQVFGCLVQSGSATEQLNLATKNGGDCYCNNVAAVTGLRDVGGVTCLSLSIMAMSEKYHNKVAPNGGLPK